MELAGEDAVEKAIRRVPQYAQGVRLQQERVAIADLRPLCRLVRSYRIERVTRLLSAYRAAGIVEFAGVFADAARTVLLPPPITESHPNGLVIIDGLHRLFLARQAGLEDVGVAVVRGDLPPLPGDPLCWDQVQLVTHSTEREVKFVNFRPNEFRPIKETIDSWIKFDVSDMFH